MRKDIKTTTSYYLFKDNWKLDVLCISKTIEHMKSQPNLD